MVAAFTRASLHPVANPRYDGLRVASVRHHHGPAYCRQGRYICEDLNQVARLTYLAPALLFVLLMGCGGGYPTLERKLNAAVGIRSYEYFVERDGPPTSLAEDSDVLVVVWRVEREEERYLAVPTRDPSTNKLIYTYTVEHGEERVLTFDTPTRLLKSWQYRSW